MSSQRKKILVAMATGTDRTAFRATMRAVRALRRATARGDTAAMSAARARVVALSTRVQ